VPSFGAALAILSYKSFILFSQFSSFVFIFYTSRMPECSKVFDSRTHFVVLCSLEDYFIMLFFEAGNHETLSEF
jgi:hypothetical protein